MATEKIPVVAGVSEKKVKQVLNFVDHPEAKFLQNDLGFAAACWTLSGFGSIPDLVLLPEEYAAACAKMDADLGIKFSVVPTLSGVLRTAVARKDERGGNARNDGGKVLYDFHEWTLEDALPMVVVTRFTSGRNRFGIIPVMDGVETPLDFRLGIPVRDGAEGLFAGGIDLRGVDAATGKDVTAESWNGADGIDLRPVLDRVTVLMEQLGYRAKRTEDQIRTSQDRRYNRNRGDRANAPVSSDDAPAQGPRGDFDPFLDDPTGR